MPMKVFEPYAVVWQAKHQMEDPETTKKVQHTKINARQGFFCSRMFFFIRYRVPIQLYSTSCPWRNFQQKEDRNYQEHLYGRLHSNLFYFSQITRSTTEYCSRNTSKSYPEEEETWKGPLFHLKMTGIECLGFKGEWALARFLSRF